ncbi:MAG: TetR/AcrR family transcriptional regulator [Acidobacteriota bacterium]
MASDAPRQTGKGSWSEAIRDARRERIVAAAARVFDDEGLDGASMRRIAAAAGCTTGAIYPLFKSKEEIYAELLRRSLGELADRLDGAGVGLESPAERVRARAVCALEYYLERPSEFALSFYLSAGLKRKGVGSDLNEVLNRQLVELDAFGRGDVAACVGDDGADLESSALFGHMTGLLVLQLRGRFSLFAGDARTLLDRYLDARFPTGPSPTGPSPT